MKLSHLLDGVTVTKMFQTVYGKMVSTHDVEIANIRYDSRRVEPNDLFVAIRGTVVDGHSYLRNIMQKRVRAIVVEDDASVPDPMCMHEGVVKIVVPDSRVALSRLSANYYGHPSRQLSVIGVTGTNGKTTITHLLSAIFGGTGGTTGLIGTIEYRIGNEVFPASHTTPESLELQELLRKMTDAGCTYAVMEVSSHALSQRRVDDVHFRAAVFTNLTQDHLDYHGTMEEYFKAKHRLFTMLNPDAPAVTNIDSPYGMQMLRDCRGESVTYGIDAQADYFAKDIRATLRGIDFTVVNRGNPVQVRSKLIGRFNVSNILAAYACASALSMDAARITGSIGDMPGIRGRFESIASPDGWIAIVDYSHTPDALQNVLSAIREIKHGNSKIITVFGCGGDRDRTKRPLMGKLAEELSDRVIITSDNPRTEDPEKILDEIIEGISDKDKIIRKVDRKEAIYAGIAEAENGDVVLIAGKGHETYQVIGRERHHFDDREVVEEYIGLQTKGKSGNPD
jgi:UDP-N-acetylmuramoyl-L-alanyl-D-glutamate--2,6-diaminopimelate ligase